MKCNILLSNKKKDVLFDKNLMRNMTPTNYSVQMMISCSRFVQNGCTPQNIDLGWNFIQNNMSPKRLSG